MADRVKTSFLRPARARSGQCHTQQMPPPLPPGCHRTPHSARMHAPHRMQCNNTTTGEKNTKNKSNCVPLSESRRRVQKKNGYTHTHITYAPTRAGYIIHNVHGHLHIMQARGARSARRPRHKLNHFNVLFTPRSAGTHSCLCKHECA